MFLVSGKKEKSKLKQSEIEVKITVTSNFDWPPNSIRIKKIKDFLNSMVLNLISIQVH